jgi:hypothetical protein
MESDVRLGPLGPLLFSQSVVVVVVVAC